MSSEYGIANAMRLMAQMGGNAVQVCITPLNSALITKSLTDSDVEDTLYLRKEHDIYVVVHGKYVYNFCRLNVPWQTKAFMFELQQAMRIGADLVIHQGKNLPELGLAREDALRNYVNQIQDVIRQCPGQNRVLLENSCHQGNELGYTLDELAKIYSMFESDVKDRVGVCIDTCHIFVAGELDMTPDKVREFFLRFDSLIGLDVLALVHLNDSKVRFDGHNDHHENLFRGHAPADGIRTFGQMCYKYNIPIILETPSTMIEEEISLVREVVIE
jgi:apurinic endonuclease APN1